MEEWNHSLFLSVCSFIFLISSKLLLIRTILAFLNNFVKIILINVSCFVIWYNRCFFFFFAFLCILWNVSFLFFKYACFFFLNDWKPYPQLTEFSSWMWRLPFDGQDCLLTLMWSLSLKQVSAVAIHRSAHWKQTGQGQGCFPLENCITQRKGVKFSRTLWHKVHFHFMEQQT